MGRHEEAFEDFADEVLERASTVEKVVLYGSVARGDHGVKSDVDVLVEVNELSEKDLIEDIAFGKTSDHGVSITPVIVEKEREKNSFLETVEKEGVERVRS